MSLPPYSNLFAIYERDPHALAAFERDLSEGGEFAEVWRPAPGWVAACAPLPETKLEHVNFARYGLAFAEGYDVLVQSSHEPTEELFGNVTRLTDRSPERLASLPGDFGFIRFRPDGDATVVRSCGGLVPFYLSRSGDRLAISTQLGNFVRYLPEEPRLDPLVNAIWTTGHGLFPDGRTFLAGVSILNRGHFARLSSESVVIGRYWDPRCYDLPRPTPATMQEHVKRLRELLISKLERDLDPAGRNLLTLSGGVDSSSLAALACGVVGRKISTWSLLPQPEHLFQHEMSYIAPLAQRFAFDRSWILRLEAETRAKLLHAAPRVGFHVLHPALCELPKITQEMPIRVMFGGEFADAVCGSALTSPDWSDETSFYQLIGSLHKLPRGLSDILRWGRNTFSSSLGRPAMPFPRKLAEFIRTEIREEYGQWYEQQARQTSCDKAPRRVLARYAEEDGFVAMNWEATSVLGVRRSIPFFTREMLELAFQCHTAELVGPGTKKLLRNALRGDVPELNLNRDDKGHWGNYLRNAQLPWKMELPGILAGVVRPEWFPRPPEILPRGEVGALTALVVFARRLHSLRCDANKLQSEISRATSDTYMVC